MTVHLKGVGPHSMPDGGSTTARDVEADLAVPEDVARQLSDVAGVDGIRGSVGIGLRSTAGTPATTTVYDLVVPERMYDGHGDLLARAARTSPAPCRP